MVCFQSRPGRSIFLPISAYPIAENRPKNRTFFLVETNLSGWTKDSFHDILQFVRIHVLAKIMDNHLVTANIFDQESGQVLAEVQLNGRTFEAAGLLGEGTMRSFKLVRGDLLDQWSCQEEMTLKTADVERTVRVSTMPAEAGAYGLIFFVD